MNRLELAVLAAALDQQTGEQVEGIITGERMREALTTGPEFSIEERRLMWFSPDVRETYFAVRQMLDDELRFNLHLAGYGGELRLRAASGGGGDVHTFEDKGYILTVFHDRIGDEDEWSLSLQLNETFRAKLFPKTVVRFFDSGGLTWIEDIPDEVGRIGALWDREIETPLERAGKFGLFIGT